MQKSMLNYAMQYAYIKYPSKSCGSEEDG